MYVSSLEANRLETNTHTSTPAHHSFVNRWPYLDAIVLHRCFSPPSSNFWQRGSPASFHPRWEGTCHRKSNTKAENCSIYPIARMVAALTPTHALMRTSSNCGIVCASTRRRRHRSNPVSEKKTRGAAHASRSLS